MTVAIQKSLRESPVARWSAMFFVSMSMFGAYYFNYAMAAEKTVLASTIGWNSTDIGVYTSAYAIFNVYFLMLIFSGIILDKLGVKLTGLGSTVVMLIGTGINYWAISTIPYSAHITIPILGSFPTQVFWSAFGFAIFGVGCEATGITLSKAIVKWFKGKEMALAMGLQMSLARIGTMFALVISIPLARHYTYKAPVALSFVLMFIGVISFIVFVVMDKKLDASEKDLELPEEEPFRIKDIVKIVSIKAFWYIAILCVLFYGAIFPFMFYANDFLINKYNVSPNWAGTITGMLPLGTIFLTPLFGYIYDRKGKGATIMIIGAVMLLFVHSFLAVPFLNYWLFAAVMIFVLGTAFSLVPAAMWASVPKFIPENQLGTAYAVIFWIQNIGLWLIPLLLGIVLTKTNPVVAPNKALIKSAITESYQKTLTAKGVTIPEKTLRIAIEKTNGDVIDSIVQSTSYVATVQKDLNLSNLKNQMVSQNVASASNLTLSSDPKIAVKQLQQSFKDATYNIVKEEKLNIRYNYESDILMFVLLGFLSVIVAFLLKAEDKKKGYGLELPNIASAAEAVKEAEMEAK